MWLLFGLLLFVWRCLCLSFLSCSYLIHPKKKIAQTKFPSLSLSLYLSPLEEDPLTQARLVGGVGRQLRRHRRHRHRHRRRRRRRVDFEPDSSATSSSSSLVTI